MDKVKVVKDGIPDHYNILTNGELTHLAANSGGGLWTIHRAGDKSYIGMCARQQIANFCRDNK